MRTAAIRLAAVPLLALLLIPAGLTAQEMEPKAYSASPVGANFFVGAVARSTGGVVFDPSLPITDASARINGVAVGFGHTFGLAGKLALVSVVVPYAWGDVTGNVGGTASATTRSGLADGRVRFSVNLRGNPAMQAAEFAKRPKQTIIGASVTVAAPTGQYYDTKLINVGTNRWAFKPEVGLSVPKGRWDLDTYLGVWFFTDNADFYPDGLRRTQNPVVAFQGHVAYTIRPRGWVAFDATWYSGGGTRVEDGDPKSGMNNTRVGATVSWPIAKRHSIKASYSSGVSVRTGTNFRTLSFGWQVLWMSPPRRTPASS